MDELAKQLSKMLDGSQKFILEQAPDVIQQFILWSRISLTLMTAISLVVAIAAIFLLWKMIHVPKDKKLSWIGEKMEMEEGFALIRSANEAFLRVLTLITDIFIITGALVATLINGYYALMVWIAPKVYLIVYITSCLK